MSVEETGDVATESVIDHHADRIGIETRDLVRSARDDGIITGVARVRQCDGVMRRYELAGSLEDFVVYAKQLAAND